MTKKGLKVSFLESLMNKTFGVGQVVSGISVQGFHASVWEQNEANFSSFFHFSNFEVQYLPEYLSKILRIYLGYPRSTA